MYKCQSSTDESRLTVRLPALPSLNFCNTLPRYHCICLSPFFIPSRHFCDVLRMYKCLCTSARNALQSRNSALQLLCEATLESHELLQKLRDAKEAQSDPSKRTLFRRMGGGGDALVQITKLEGKAAAGQEILTKRRLVYAQVGRPLLALQQPGVSPSTRLSFFKTTFLFKKS